MKFTLAQAASHVAGVMRGGAELAVALAKQDWASDAVVMTRRALCRECPSRTSIQLPGMESKADWCGPPLVGSDEPPTCGCQLYLATAVKSKACPQGRW